MVASISMALFGMHGHGERSGGSDVADYSVILLFGTVLYAAWSIKMDGTFGLDKRWGNLSRWY